MNCTFCPILYTCLNVIISRAREREKKPPTVFPINLSSCVISQRVAQRPQGHFWDNKRSHHAALPYHRAVITPKLKKKKKFWHQDVLMTLKSVRFSPRLDTQCTNCARGTVMGVLSGNLLDSGPAQSQMHRRQSHSGLERQPKLAVWDWTGAKVVTPITRLALRRSGCWIDKDREGGNKSNRIMNSLAATEKKKNWLHQNKRKINHINMETDPYVHKDFSVVADILRTEHKR